MTYFIMGFMFWLLVTVVAQLLKSIEVGKGNEALYSFLITSVIYATIYIFIII